MEFEVVVPTRNGGSLFHEFVRLLVKQNGLQVCNVTVIDSESCDDTAIIARSAGFVTISIPKAEFSHGGTRNFAMSRCTSNHVVFLTQDALLEEPDACQKIVDYTAQNGLAACFGRQLPHEGADILAAFARGLNYPDQSYICDIKSDKPKGIRKIFMSNSFACYDREKLFAAGSFDPDTFFGEDTLAAAALLRRGEMIGYYSKAAVRHSHNYTLLEEFRRYFDIGFFHSNHTDILKEFGTAEREAGSYVFKLLKFLRSEGQFSVLPVALAQAGAKYLGYKLGRSHEYLPASLVRQFSMYGARK
jgi:rhamnosyltransferase